MLTITAIIWYIYTTTGLPLSNLHCFIRSIGSPHVFERLANRVHVELGRGIVKKAWAPLHQPVFTSTKVSMAGFTVSGIESETSYLERTWPLFAAKELRFWNQLR